jgi:hypothetical protein
VLARRRPSGHTEQEVTLVIAGIDTHKDTLAVAVVDEAGRLVAGGDVPNTERGFAKLVDMFNTHHVQRVGIEGSGSFGRAVAVHLVVCWQPDRPATVVEVPTLLTSRERRGQLGKGKTDPVDALAIARITAREQQLPPVRLTAGAAADLRALLDYREDLETISPRTPTETLQQILAGLKEAGQRPLAGRPRRPALVESGVDTDDLPDRPLRRVGAGPFRTGTTTPSVSTKHAVSVRTGRPHPAANHFQAAAPDAVMARNHG